MESSVTACWYIIQSSKSRPPSLFINFSAPQFFTKEVPNAQSGDDQVYKFIGVPYQDGYGKIGEGGEIGNQSQLANVLNTPRPGRTSARYRG